MAAFAVFAPSRARDLDLLGIDRNNLELRPHYKQVELAPGRFAPPCLKDNSGFQRVRRRNQPRLGQQNVLEERLAFRFSKKDGDEGRRINDHEQEPLARDTVLAVAEDFVLGARIESGKRINAPQ